MTDYTKFVTLRLQAILDELDIPRSYYELARDRYHSLSEWMLRPESTVARYNPTISPQGSFRYGTVNRPFLRGEEYDLDLVAKLKTLTKVDVSQKRLKELVGKELQLYCVAKGVKEQPEDKHRCWRIDYADEVCFHMDILPSLPEEEGVIRGLIQIGVPEELAVTAIAITDDRSPSYANINRNWETSNPKGFAEWFESRMKLQAEARLQSLIHEGLYASVEDIPAWEWKTPLQQVIQILKRHRDVMFKDNPEFAPISMIITTLSAHAYEGENNTYEALTGILNRMRSFVRPQAPHIPNPTNPREDFADRWHRDTRYEAAFWKWYTQVRADLAVLSSGMGREKLREHLNKIFGIILSDEKLVGLTNTEVDTGRPTVVVSSPPKPWRKN